MLCKGSTPAYKRYQRDSMYMSITYAILVLCSAWLVKHGGQTGKVYLYFWSLLPAVPLVGMVFRMAKYLNDETDEYQRMMATQALLIGTAALVITLLVNDFLRAFAKASPLEPFVAFVVFSAAMGLTKAVQWLRDRVRDDD